jgi:hypothetical protein
MPIQLTAREIDIAIPKVAEGLRKYMWLQSNVATMPRFYSSPEFQRKFNGFYRVRRSLKWRTVFFNLMDRALRERLTFHTIVDLLLTATGRYEASFASKLFATLNPSAPVIDSVVVKKLGLRVPPAWVPNRAAEILKLHNELAALYAQFLPSPNGHYLIQQFNAAYPAAVTAITAEKKLDLVLWQSRANKETTRETQASSKG